MRVKAIRCGLFLMGWLWLIALIPRSLLAQPSVLPSSEVGLPFIQHFTPKDYDAHSQNWAILQDQRGLMYFANGIGVLEYDGVSWRLISVPNESGVYSLGMDQQGRIYVGAKGDFGYLAADSLGQRQFVSLLDDLATEYRDFSSVWDISITAEGVYFRSREYLFRWNEASAGQGSLKVWQPETEFYRFYTVQDTHYLVQRQIGLMKLVDDEWQLVPGGERFAKKYIYLMLPFPAPEASSSRLLIGTRARGFFMYDGTTFESFPLSAEVEALINEQQLYEGLWLSNGQLALLLRTGGVAIINQQGQLQQLLNQEAGLDDESARFAYQDQQGGLWVALNNGLSRIEVPSSFSYFDKTLGLESDVSTIVRHRGGLYVGGNRGVYRLSPTTPANHHPRFQFVEDMTTPTWSLLSIDEALWAATNVGVYRMTEDKTTKIVDQTARFLYRSPTDPNIMFVGMRIGLVLLKKMDGQWQILGRVQGVSESIRSIVEERKGVIWLGTSGGDGYIRVRLDEADLISPQSEEIPATVARYQQAQGVPGGYARLYSVDGRVVFATDAGLKRLDEASGQFVPDTSLGAQFADTTLSVSRVVEDPQGNVWIKSTLAGGTRETGRLRRKAKGERIYQSTAFNRIADWGSTYVMYPDPQYENVVWIGGPEGIVRYDHSIQKDYRTDFQTLIRRVTLPEDSLLFGGLATPSTVAPTLRFADHNLRLVFAATSYEESGANQYQVFLEGFDPRWSVWTNETRKDYTNLSEGDYTFRVRARNLYGHLSDEGNYAFTILPPWHRTWWSYLLQGLLACGLVLGFIRWRLRAVQRQTIKLEQVVADRTEELAEKNEQLQEMDTIKSRFFTNISHEFRTPLTLVMGQIESFLTAPDTNKLKMAHRNAAQLQHLINQLLDLSKLEGGKMTLKASCQNIVPLLRQLTSTFESMAQKKHIALRFESTSSTIRVYYEHDKVEKILYNLLSNALKFTPSGGQVLVNVATAGGGSSQVGTSEEKSKLKISVRDSGVGIPSDRLPHIFDHFFQVDSSQTREFEGTGIGLALTKELVQLHGGGIAVESTEGFGTTFTVTLPLGTAHLRAEQIVDTPEVATGWEKLPGSAFEELLSPEEVSPSDNLEPIDERKDLILMVEDHADMRTYIRQGLEKAYHILEAANGEEGFVQAQKHVPDLIITDVMMPQVDGYEFTRKIRQETVTAHIPIIMLTAKAAEEDKLAGLEQGVDAYLTKPFNKEELLIRVRKLIEMRQKLRQQTGGQIILQPGEIAATSLDQQFLQQIQQTIEDNINNEAFGVDKLALEVGVSQRQLQRKLKALTDSSPQQCIRTMRLSRAKQLLEQGTGTVSEVCFQVGYGNVNAFTRAFREEFGAAPSVVLQKKSS